MTITSDAPLPAEFSDLSKRIREAKSHQEFTSALDAMTEFLSKQHDVSAGAQAPPAQFREPVHFGTKS